ncbi:MAG: outer membrane beta-barrel protein, partial [Bacteroidota bacterium]
QFSLSWLIASLLLLPLCSFGQFEALEIRYGVAFQQNFAAQINYNPLIPQDGRFQWNSLHTYGLGAFYERSLSPKWSVELYAAYQLKGYREIAQLAEVGIPNSFRENEFHNRFRYLSVRVHPTYYLSHSHLFRPYLSAGLQGDFLLNYDLASDRYPINLFYPVNEYGDFRRWSIGYVLRAGVLLNNLLALEWSFQHDLTSILDKENLRVWNWVPGINFRLNVQEISRAIQKKSDSIRSPG